MTDVLPIDWTLHVDVPVEAELHRLVRQTLEQRPADRRPVHRAVLGALTMLLGRPLPLRATVHGDAVGVANVSVDLPSGPRRTLRLVAAAIPSRWRWRSEGEALVGRGPREVRPVSAEDVVSRRLICMAFAFPDEVGEVVLEGLPVPVQGLRRGEVTLRAVRPEDGEVTFRLRFDEPSLAEAAASGVEALLARIAVEHAAHGLAYDGAWSIEGDCVLGVYRGIPTPGWPAVLARLVDDAPRSRDAAVAARQGAAIRPG